jgi:hypothetical protein
MQSQAVPTAADAQVGVVRTDSARVAAESASAGSSQATACQPLSASASAPIAVSATVQATTATLRSRTSRSTEYGAARVSSLRRVAARP